MHLKTKTNHDSKNIMTKKEHGGIKMNAIKTLDIYFQPATTTVYYLATLTDGSEVKSEALIVE